MQGLATCPPPDECNPWTVALEGLAAALSFGEESDDVAQRYRAAVWLCAASSALTFIVSSLTANYSQVDKLWSIVPFLYAWIPIVYSNNINDGGRDGRSLLMAILATIWGARLTYNFHRRGGYCWPPWKGDEDYRWSYIQKGDFVRILSNPSAWVLFNLLFISIYQNILLLLIATPSLVVADLSSRSTCHALVVPLNLVSLDGLVAVVFLSLVVIETIADNQQWKFQLEKARRRATSAEASADNSNNDDDYAVGFCRTGLFSIVRKPNYAAEQAIWICYYFFSVSATGGVKVWNWSICGRVLLVLLFQGSGWFTEMLSERKYPAYSDYKKMVPLYIPLVSGLLIALVRSRRNKQD